MSELGINIAKLRKEAQMTQSELGEKLSISPQAVSKWEKGMSEPDTDTLKKIAKLFNVSLDELFGVDENPKEEQKSERVTEEKEVAATEAPKFVQQPLAYCSVCKKPLYTLNEVVEGTKQVTNNKRTTTVPTGVIYCQDCHREDNLRSIAHYTEQAYIEKKKSYNKSWTVASISAGLVLLLLIIIGVAIKDYVFAFAGGIAIAYVVFATVVQAYWDDTVLDILLFFSRSFNMPGVIFTLDLDGIIWLITVKIGLAILSFLLSAFIFMIGLVVAGVVATICFPFKVVSYSKKMNAEKGKSDKAKSEYENFKKEREIKKQKEINNA